MTTENIDPDTDMIHSSPEGLFHHKKRKDGKYYANIKVPHFIIKLHQEIFPELEEQMRKNPQNATIQYAVWLSLLPLAIKNKLPDNLRRKIMKVYGLI